MGGAGSYNTMIAIYCSLALYYSRRPLRPRAAPPRRRAPPASSWGAGGGAVVLVRGGPGGGGRWLRACVRCR